MIAHQEIVPLRRRRFLVPLASGLLLGVVLGSRVKDAATDADVIDGVKDPVGMTGLIILLIVVAVVGALLLFKQRTRIAGIGILIGVVAWGAGFAGGDVLGPRHPTRIATMDVSIDGSLDLEVEGSARCSRYGDSFYMLTAPVGGDWRSGASSLEFKVVNEGSGTPLLLFVGDRSTGHILYATDSFDDLGFQHRESRDAAVDAVTPLSGTSGRLLFRHLPLLWPQPFTIDDAVAPAEISGQIDWSCST